MAKKIMRYNFRIVIEPTLPFRWRAMTDEEYTKRIVATCEEIREQVKRHVDSVYAVEIKNDATEICEYCQNEWEVATVDDIDPDEPKELTWIIDEPMCCCKASNEWRDEHGYPRAKWCSDE